MSNGAQGQEFGRNTAPQRMYELEYPAPAIENSESQGPTLIVALHGYADAGQAVEACADHLKAALDNVLLASFDTDELIDYRSRRPATSISTDGSIEVEDLELDLRVIKDSSGQSFLLLSGPEPDLKWQSFSKAVQGLVERFKIEDSIVLYSAPAPVPHTRPLVVSAHGNSSPLVSSMFRLDATLIVPGSAQLFLERSLGEHGTNVAGYTAHVPHYLSASAYPAATLNLLSSIQDSTGLKFPLGSLESDVERFGQQLEQQLDPEGDDERETNHLVSQLEAQYDDYVERFRLQQQAQLEPADVEVPSAEELAAEIEAFLEAASTDPDVEDNEGHE